jgi:hypothetical protein
MLAGFLNKENLAVKKDTDAFRNKYQFVQKRGIDYYIENCGARGRNRTGTESNSEGF